MLRTSYKKKVTGKCNTDTENAQRTTLAANHHLTISRPKKITDLLTKNNKNEYIYPNQNFERLLKTQGATSNVKVCAKL
jgi:hypothetical protein